MLRLKKIHYHETSNVLFHLRTCKCLLLVHLLPVSTEYFLLTVLHPLLESKEIHLFLTTNNHNQKSKKHVLHLSANFG